MLTQLSENDRLVGALVLQLLLRAPGACDGLCLTSDQLLVVLDQMRQRQEMLPRVPVGRILLVVSSLEHKIAPQLDGSPAYTLWLCWNREKLLALRVGGTFSRTEIDELETIGKLAHAEVFFPEDGLLFSWFGQ